MVKPQYSTPDIAPSSFSANESYYTVFQFTATPQYTATNCSEQTVVLYYGMTVYSLML